MNLDMYDKTIAICQKSIEQINNQNNSVIIFLGHHHLWNDEIRAKCNDNESIEIISNTDEFKSFIKHNGCHKMFIHLDMEESGIDLAEELELNDYFGELHFVSVARPVSEDLKRIDELGAKFVLKDDVATVAQQNSKEISS